MAEPKTWFLSAADRITNQATISAGEVAGDRDTGETSRRTLSGWVSLGLGDGGGGSSGVSGTLHQREFTVASGAAATVLYLFDFGSDIITNLQIEVIRTSGTAPAIPQLATAVIKQSSAGPPVIGDFAAPADGTANGSRYPIMPTEQGSNARIIDPTTAIRHVGVKLEAAAGANYIIFCTAGS